MWLPPARVTVCLFRMFDLELNVISTGKLLKTKCNLLRALRSYTNAIIPKVLDEKSDRGVFLAKTNKYRHIIEKGHLYYSGCHPIWKVVFK